MVTLFKRLLFRYGGGERKRVRPGLRWAQGIRDRTKGTETSQKEVLVGIPFSKRGSDKKKTS